MDQVSTSGSTGAGQQDPATSSSDFTVACFIVRQMMAQMDTMKLVQVKAVHGGGGAIARAGTVDVLPLVSLIDGAANATPQGTVYGIPWWRLQGGGAAVICDPKVGDIGYVVVADRDISNVKAAVADGKPPQTNPGSFRKYSVADGIYVGGCLNDIPSQYIVFSDTGVQIVDGKGNVLKMSASGFEITPAGGILKVNGTVQATAAVIAGFGGPDQVGLQTHNHPTAPTGPVSPPTPGS